MQEISLHLGSDHAGFGFKQKAIEFLQTKGLKYRDHGTFSDASCDYPDFADAVCQAVTATTGQMGLLICGSGQGMAMRANKYPKIRAALCYSVEVARLSRQHNDANVVCLGARMQDEQTLIAILAAFLSEPFEGGRHQLRVDKMISPVPLPKEFKK